MMMESLKPPSIQRSLSDGERLRTNDYLDDNRRSLSDSHINDNNNNYINDNNNTNKRLPSLPIKEIINDTWELKKKVGKGSFCDLFVAKNILSSTLLSSTSFSSTSLQYCAIKVSTNDDHSSIIRAEGI